MSLTYAPIDVTIPEDRWAPIGWHSTPNEDPWIRLMGPPLCINGCLMHVMAYQVKTVNDVQEPAHRALVEDYLLMQQIYEGAYETVTVRNREYVLIIHPYSD
jgi:hypothetical protein